MANVLVIEKSLAHSDLKVPLHPSLLFNSRLHRREWLPLQTLMLSPAGPDLPLMCPRSLFQSLCKFSAGGPFKPVLA